MVRELAEVEIEARDGVAVVAVRGEIDLSNAEATFAVLKRAADKATAGLVIDLSELAYIDSAGVRLLFLLARAVNGNGSVLHAVVPKGARILRVLELADAEQVMALDETPDEAVARVSTL
jgi:anti-sigma B factor antagonist